MITLVRTNRGYQQEDHGASQEESEHPPVAFARQVNPDRREGTGGLHDLTMPQECADNRHHQADNRESGRNEIRQDTDVRVGKVGRRLQYQQKQKGKKTADDDDEPT